MYVYINIIVHVYGTGVYAIQLHCKMLDLSLMHHIFAFACCKLEYLAYFVSAIYILMLQDLIILMPGGIILII